jgi:dGTPase
MSRAANVKQLVGLIRQDRLRESSKRGELIESESDKGRVINSSAFRRLQQKAQVFPLDPNAAVRTRLTHSIEVAQIGRYIAQKVVKKDGNYLGDYEKAGAFVNVVETACLLHDIGNPPFGHLGEAAIRGWFSKHKPGESDLCSFDGNPHGFRLITFLAGKDNYGLNLTATTLLATVKYPITEARRSKGKKFGLFANDEKTYTKACSLIGWKPGRKFPCAQLMDAADEIAYSLSDLEDGLEKDIVSLAELKKEFGPSRFKSDTTASIIAFKTGVINEAVEIAARTFHSRLDDILSGAEIELVDPATEVSGLLESIRAFARKRLYVDPTVERVELAGKSAIDGLLRHYGSLLKLGKGDFTAIRTSDRDVIKNKALDFHVRLFHRLPGAYCQKYEQFETIPESARRAHLVVDYVAGMTDDFALQMYQTLEGIKIA